MGAKISVIGTAVTLLNDGSWGSEIAKIKLSKNLCDVADLEIAGEKKSLEVFGEEVENIKDDRANKKALNLRQLYAEDLKAYATELKLYADEVTNWTNAGKVGPPPVPPVRPVKPY